jgi:octaprenyl-diphosphate synthase
MQPYAATAELPAHKASLDALYSLIRPDLARVDALILERVRSDVPLIADVARHIIASGGKRIRPALTLICAQLCGYRGDQHIALASAIEFIHTATLLHDDVVDESKLRRGIATANDLFGNKASVLVGDFLLSQAFQLMVADGSPKVLRILSDTSAIIAKGEVMQLMTEGAPETTTERYLEVIAAKTAALFAAACELGAVAGGNPAYEAPLYDFGMHIGTAFQLIDDVLDYNADQETLGKTIGDDFREGKITLPVILAYAAGNAEEKAFWQRSLGDLQQQPGDLAAAIRLMDKHQALAQSVALAGEYCERARRAIDGFPPSPAKTAMLDMVDFCAGRVY